MPNSRTPLLLALATLLVTAALGLTPDTARAAGRRAMVPVSQRAGESLDGARVIVKYKNLGPLMKALRASGQARGGPHFAATMARRHGLALTDGRTILANSQVLRGDRSLSSAQLAAKLAQDPDVEYAVPDYRRYALAAPNDPLFAASTSISPNSGQWYLQAPDSAVDSTNPGYTNFSGINAPAAWAITTGSASIVVADLDTGVRPDHPDLVNKLIAPSTVNIAAGFTGPFIGWDFVSSTTTANDGGGRDADASDPGDWTTANECGSGESAEDSSWHGTQTAGLIGAETDNGIGMASIGRNVKLEPVRVLGRCGGTDSDIQAAMLWAAGISVAGVPDNPHPAKVISMSLGGSGSCPQTYVDTINQLTARGVVVVVAAGNDEGLAVDTPGNCAGVITVAALRNVGTKVGFSSLGPQVSIGAPGGNCVNLTGACLFPILTTTNSGTTTPGTNTYSDAYNPSLGTSFATPLVAGTVALMLTANPALTPTQVKSMLQSTARTFPTTSAGATTPVAMCQAPSSTTQDECICTTSTCGAGMLDAGAAVAAASASATPQAAISASASAAAEGATVTFDASGSTVPSGRSISTYQWAFTANAAGAAFNGATNGSLASVTATTAGSYTVQLVITDSSGAHAAASASVSVTPPAAPTVHIVASATSVSAGTSVTLDGSTSTAATPLTIASYAWTITGGTSNLATIAGAANGSSVTLDTNPSSSGAFSVSLTVTDSLGQQTSLSQSITVTAVVPTATISASAASVTVGTNVSFDGSGSSATTGRTITGYQWTITSGSGIAAISGSSTGSSALVTTSGSGTFAIQLAVTDSVGATATRSTSVTVTAAGTASSGGGGGAMNPAWALGVAAAALALFALRRRD